MITITDRQQDFDLTMPSAWVGHREFANWLVVRTQPSVIVDLGVDWGFSTFALAESRIGEVYGIDLFRGDAHAGALSEDQGLERYQGVLDFAAAHNMNHVHIIRDDFNNVAKTWTRPIDILHIDGLHTREAVENDYNTWTPFLKENGVVLFHDTNSHQSVKEFFNTIELPKVNFDHSAGLGVVTRNEELLAAIRDKWNLS
jgi:hypothetical protein